VLTLSQELGNKYCETITLTRLAERAWSATDRAGAGRLFRRAVALAERLGDRPSLIRCLHGLARLSQVEGDLDRATRLLAAAQSVSPDESGRDDEVTALREGLGQARFLTAWMAGRSMDAGEAARYAAEGPD
jgi:Flp pilus assembly protein TadD